jgi:hypothetical protein
MLLLKVIITFKNAYGDIISWLELWKSEYVLVWPSYYFKILADSLNKCSSETL